MTVKKTSTKISAPNLLLKKDYLMVVMGDQHAGHLAGLTPTSYWGNFITKDINKRNKLVRGQKAFYTWWKGQLASLHREQPIDILINNGDLVDGLGWRSGGTELHGTDMNLQIQMGKDIINDVGAKHNIILAGTDYHTSLQGTDIEETIANEVGCKFESHAFIDIRGRVFDIKHHVGSSGSPSGRYSPIAREKLWASLWSQRDLIPSHIDYLIRSHCHYYSYTEDTQSVAMTLPALQGFGSKFGIRRCSGTIDLGFVSFLIKTNGNVIFRKHIASFPEQKATVTKFN